MKKDTAYKLLLVAALSLLAGCESKEEREKAKEAIAFKDEQVRSLQSAKEQEKPAPQKEEKTEITLMEPKKEIKEENRSILSQMGIESGEGKLVIDTHKTKEFFVKLSDDLKEVAGDIKKEIKENNLTITKSIGIEHNGTSLSIDLNKTKTFFDDLGARVDNFIKEINTTN